MIASEATPWSKTGGLGDVAGALPEALETLGHIVTLIVPKHRGTNEPTAVAVAGSRAGITYHQLAITPRRRVVFVEAGSLFDRPGIYGERGTDYADSAIRFAAFSAAALDYVELNRDFPPVDVVHAHDWQTGLIPARLRKDPRWPSLERAGVVFTIHNLAYQGLFPKETVPALGLPWSLFGVESGEFWGKFSFLKAGITAADYVTTVSPTYAEETRTKQAGVGLEGVLSALGARYVGILNGIDTTTWNPATDPFLPAHFDASDLAGKAECKRALLAHFGLPQGDDALGRPLVGLVSRLVKQKGLDLIAAASTDLVSLDATWVFLGTGEPRYERMLTELAAAHPSRVVAHIGFEERLAHLIEGGIGHLPHAVGIRAVRPQSDVQPSVRDRADRSSGWRTRRYRAALHGQGPQGQRLQVPTPITRVVRPNSAPGHAAVSEPRGLAPFDVERNVGRSLLDDAGAGICQSVQTCTRVACRQRADGSTSLAKGARRDGFRKHSDLHRRQL